MPCGVIFQRDTRETDTESNIYIYIWVYIYGCMCWKSMGQCTYMHMVISHICSSIYTVVTPVDGYVCVCRMKRCFCAYLLRSSVRRCVARVAEFHVNRLYTIYEIEVYGVWCLMLLSIRLYIESCHLKRLETDTDTHYSGFQD